MSEQKLAPFHNPEAAWGSERESLIRAIDVLSLDVLRLKSENEQLRTTLSAYKLGQVHDSQAHAETVWTKAYNYYKREGLKNTIKKVFHKLTGSQI